MHNEFRIRKDSDGYTFLAPLGFWNHKAINLSGILQIFSAQKFFRFWAAKQPLGKIEDGEEFIRIYAPISRFRLGSSDIFFFYLFGFLIIYPLNHFAFQLQAEFLAGGNFYHWFLNRFLSEFPAIVQLFKEPTLRYTLIMWFPVAMFLSLLFTLPMTVVFLHFFSKLPSFATEKIFTPIMGLTHKRILKPAYQLYINLFERQL